MERSPLRLGSRFIVAVPRIQNYPSISTDPFPLPRWFSTARKHKENEARNGRGIKDYKKKDQVVKPCPPDYINPCALVFIIFGPHGFSPVVSAPPRKFATKSESPKEYEPSVSPESVLGTRPPAKRSKVKNEDGNDDVNLAAFLRQSAESAATLNAAIAALKKEDVAVNHVENPIVAKLKSILANPALKDQKRIVYAEQLLEIEEKELMMMVQAEAMAAQTPVAAPTATTTISPPALRSPEVLVLDAEGDGEHPGNVDDLLRSYV